MSKRLIFTPQAEQDFDQAYWWYEEQLTGLSKEFVRCVDAKIAMVQRNPLHYQIIYEDTVRRALVSRFPYAIYFVDEPESITILAIIDQRSDPEKWRQRV